MQSTGHQGASALPDRSKDYFSSTDEKSSSDAKMREISKSSTSGQSWEPKFDRRHSWSQEDRKHELQGRLLSVDRGSEKGFSETDRH